MLNSSDERECSVAGNILVFDGEPLILDLLASVLQREGYQVTATRLGDEAMDLVNAHSYDLAIADLELHTMEGRRLIDRIRQVSPETHVMATTAYPALDIVAFAEEYAEAFLTKPFGIGDLLSAVHRVLDGRAVGDAYGRATLVPYEGAPMLAANS
jgi:CheY-like chemotaxis protein